MTEEFRSRYRIKGQSISLDVPHYDSTVPLRIDPIVVVRIAPRTTDALQGRSARALTSDSIGNLYLGGEDRAWVSMMDPTGTSEIYRTYIGSTSLDVVNALKVDLQGNVHVAGSRRLNGTEKGFVATLDAQGQQSAYTEFDTPALALAVDSTGAVYVAGDAFVTKVGGWTMVPPGPVRSVGVDANGHVYIAGHRPAPVGNGGTGDEAYVAKLNDESNAWAWVVPMGGTGTVNEAQSLAIDTDGSVYVAGVTNSFDFPVRNGYQDRMGGIPQQRRFLI